MDELFYSVEEKSKSQEKETQPHAAERKRRRKRVWLCTAVVVIILIGGILIAAIGHKENVKEPIPIDEIDGIVIDTDEIIGYEFDRD